MNSLHSFILDIVREDVHIMLEKRSYDTKTISDHLCYSVLFKNYRRKNNSHLGLRLTFSGHTILKKHFVCYSYNHKTFLSNKVLHCLDKKMSWPYHISNNNVIFYSENDSAWFKLNENNLETFLDYI